MISPISNGVCRCGCIFIAQLILIAHYSALTGPKDSVSVKAEKLIAKLEPAAFVKLTSQIMQSA